MDTRAMLKHLRQLHIERAEFARIARSDPDFFILRDMKREIIEIENTIRLRAANGDLVATAFA